MFCLQVVQYVGYVDCEDTENGHGTHVGGSAAGGMSNASPGDHFGDGVSENRFVSPTATVERGRQARAFETVLPVTGRNTAGNLRLYCTAQ